MQQLLKIGAASKSLDHFPLPTAASTRVSATSVKNVDTSLRTRATCSERHLENKAQQISVGAQNLPHGV
jgi:hypothetical protein